MAIQVSGTEVISNSRVLSNVTGLKTVSGNSILGSGDIAVGASTDVNGVGTYTIAADISMTNASGSSFRFVYKEGRTVAGSVLRAVATQIINGGSSSSALDFGPEATSTTGTGTAGGVENGPTGYGAGVSAGSNQRYSGSWRMMTPGAGLTANATGQSYAWYNSYCSLWVRYA